MVCGIYLITRKDTSQKYVGQSNNIEGRWKEHKRGKDKDKSRIDKAILKHGKDKFTFQIITVLPCDQKVLFQHERYWIKFYNAFENKFHYNLTPGGEGVGAGEDNPFFGKQHSEEFKKRMSERMSGKNHPHYGKVFSEEVRRNMSEAQKGEKSHKWGTSLIEKFGGMDFLKDCIKEGKSQFEVEKIIGVSRGQISNYLRFRNTTWNDLRIELTGNKGWSIINDLGGLEFLKECIEDRKSLNEVADEIGTTHSNITYYLKIRGYTWTGLYKKITGNVYSIIDGLGGLEFLKECIKEGKTQKEIAEENGISSETIRVYLIKRGYSWEKLKEEVTGSEHYSVIDEFGGLEFLKECIKEGRTQKEIAEKFGLSTKNIRNYLKNNGYTWKSLTNEVLGSEHYSVIDEFGGLDFIRNCIKESKTQEDIAEEFGLSTKNIRNYLKNNGYTWKSLRKEVLGSEHYSVIDEFGGLDFLKKCIGEGRTRNDVAENIGFKNASNINYYLKKRGYTWKSLRKEVLGSEHYSVIDEFGGLDFIRNCIKESKTQEDIAKELGLDSTTAIRYYLKNNGYTWAQLKEEVTGSKQYSIDDFGGLDFLKECIRNRKTQEDIAKERGLGINSIRKYLKKRGYTWTQLKKETLGNEHYSVIDDFGGLDFLKECIRNRKTQEDIAKELGLDSTSAIRYYLKKRGYTWKKLKNEVDAE